MDIELSVLFKNILLIIVINILLIVVTIIGYSILPTLFVLRKKYYGSLTKEENTKRKAFGNPIIGIWYCPSCHYSIFPNELEKLKNSFTWSDNSKSVLENFTGPHCKECNVPMEYDESE